MNKLLNPIGVRDFIQKYQVDENIFEVIPDFAFIKSVAMKAKENNCTCGLGQEINSAILHFNKVIQNLKPGTIKRVKEKFNLEQVCFNIQTAELYEVKCY